MINSTSSNKEKTNSLINKLDIIFNAFFKILDFNELDVNRFLSDKETKRYKFLIIKKYIIFLLFEIVFLTPNIYLMLLNIYEIEINTTTWVIVNLFFSFSVCFLALFYRGIIMHFDEEFKYSKPYYRKKKKKMKKFCRQFNLIINNQHLIEEIGEENYNNKYKHNIKRINNRIDYYTNLFRSFWDYISQFGIISIITIIVINIISTLLGIYPKNINIEALIISLSILIGIGILSFYFFKRFNNRLIIKLSKDKNVLIESESLLDSKLKDITKHLQKKIELKFNVL